MDKVLQFFSDNKDALTAIGIILTFLVSSISLYFSVRNNKAVHYTNTVTKNRIEWINGLRKLCAEYIAYACLDGNIFYDYNSEDENEKASEQMIHIRELTNEIKLMLNFSGKTDREIINKVDEITELYMKFYDEYCDSETTNGLIQMNDEMKTLSDKVENDIEELTKKLQIYLKAEWNRVKYESQGRTYEKATQEFDVWELEQKYDNPEYKNDVWKRIRINAKAKVKRICSISGFAVFVICIVIFVAIIFIIA